MAKIHIDEKTGFATFEIETPQGFQAFRRGKDDCRHWAMHPETNELKKFQAENTKHARVFVKYGDFTKRLK